MVWVNMAYVVSKYDIWSGEIWFIVRVNIVCGVG